MTKYREILRLSNLGLSQQSIANSCGVPKKTFNLVLKKAREINISWTLDANDTCGTCGKVVPIHRQICPVQ